MRKPLTLIVAVAGSTLGVRALSHSKWFQANAPDYREQFARWFLWDARPEH